MMILTMMEVTGNLTRHSSLIGGGRQERSQKKGSDVKQMNYSHITKDFVVNLEILVRTTCISLMFFRPSPVCSI